MSRAAIATVLLLATAAPAGAAAAPAGWTAPGPVRSSFSAAPGLPGTPAVALDGDGLGVAVADTGGAGAVGPSTRASAFTNGTFLDPFRLTGTDTAVGPGSGAVAAYGDHGLVVAGVHRRQASSRVVLTTGTLSANRVRIGPLRAVGPATLRASTPALAVNAAGAAAVVYAVCRDGACEDALVYLTVRRARTGTLRTVRLTDGAGPLPRVAAAINARGDALAVWTDATGVFARVRTAGGALRARQRVGTTRRGAATAPSAALSADRTALVGWATAVVHEGGPTAGEVRVGQAADRGRFTQTRLGTLPAVSGRPVAGALVRVGLDARGVRHVAWTAGDAVGRLGVRSARIEGAAFARAVGVTAVTTVSDPATDTVLDDLELPPGGGEVITLRAHVHGTQDPDVPTVVQVASRDRPAGPWTRTTVSDPTEDATSASTAVAAGRTVTVWGTATGTARYAERVDR